MLHRSLGKINVYHVRKECNIHICVWQIFAKHAYTHTPNHMHTCIYWIHMHTYKLTHVHMYRQMQSNTPHTHTFTLHTRTYTCALTTLIVRFPLFYWLIVQKRVWRIVESAKKSILIYTHWAVLSLNYQYNAVSVHEFLTQHFCQTLTSHHNLYKKMSELYGGPSVKS